MSLLQVLLIVWLHFVGDFLFQSDNMAVNKSKSFKWLTLHLLAYASVWILFGWKFTLLNLVLHGIVDFCTSRLTSWLWQHEKRHWFFVVIGLDQAIHLTCLFSTLPFAEYEILSKFFTGC